MYLDVQKISIQLEVQLINSEGGKTDSHLNEDCRIELILAVTINAIVGHMNPF